MSAPASRSEHQRAIGALRVAVKQRDGQTVLSDLYQQGCLKARFPRPVDWMETVLLNSSGGVAGGDRLDIALEVAPGASACFTAQAAERFYRALPGDPPSRLRTALRIHGTGAAEWLPQETILFDSSALDRRLEIEMDADSWFLGVESLIFGRLSMGEQVHTARLSDTIRIRREGRLILHDAIRLTGPVAEILNRPATANGNRAVATLIHVSPDAESHLAPLREAWAESPAETGASAWNNMLLARILAPTSATLRTAVTTALNTLREGRTLPRVWNC